MALLLAAVLAQENPRHDALSYLVRHHQARECTCAPLKPGDPGRIVSAFLANSYSDLSADEFEGEKIGAVLGRLLAGITAAQREDGLFYADDPAANAWMAFALTETYVLTGRPQWAAPARRAAEAIQGMPASDDVALFLQALVLQSAFSAKLIPIRPELPPPGNATTALDIAMTDHHFALGRGHRRQAHVDWRRELEPAWFARQLKDGCRSGAWGGSVEETSYVITVLGRYCWACKTFGR
ncbi:MAG: hypothetical protein L0Z62_19345 [Gemmataceae bacterium]|nr:hypothetical protein [Gemmataceae bacterium]